MFLDPITNVETNEYVVSLTFDDGPHPEYTPETLKILCKYNAKATFFIVGEAAKKFPEVVKMISDHGHEIGNHSWSHSNLKSVKSRLRRLKQLWKCQNATAPYSSRIFRPPYGAQNKQVQLDAFIMRYKLILWNVSAQDWVFQNSEEIAEKIIRRCAPGNIFLLHDAIYKSYLSDTETPYDRMTMINGLDRALDTLSNKFRFVTVSEMLNCGRPVSNWPIKSMA